MTRMCTGVPGLDVLLGGGLPAGHVYLLRGEPGTGKTTLSMHFLSDGCERDEPCLYLSLSQSRADLLKAAASLQLNISGAEVEDTGALFSLDRRAPQSVFRTSDFDIEQIVSHLNEVIGRLKPRRVILDSLVDLQLMCADRLAYRRLFRELKDMFARQDCTALIVDSNPDFGGDSHVLALVHGVMTLHRELPGYGIAQRRLEINKMRGLDHAEGLHDFSIGTAGMRVFPRLSTVMNDTQPTLEQISTGLAGLDELLGGGLESGTSCFIFGQAGVGKSTLASVLLHAALKRGENALAFLFEEHPRTFVQRGETVGLSLSSALNDSRLRLVQLEAGDVVPGKFVHQVLDSVTEAQPRVLVIDSVSGYLSASADKDYRVAQLNALLTNLRQRDIITVMVMEQAGLLADEKGRPGPSVVSDSVILLRQYEWLSDIRRSIAVIKKRAGPHLTETREFVIAPGAIEIKPIGEDRRRNLRHVSLLGSRTSM